METHSGSDSLIAKWHRKRQSLVRKAVRKLAREGTHLAFHLPALRKRKLNVALLNPLNQPAQTADLVAEVLGHMRALKAPVAGQTQ